MARARLTRGADADLFDIWLWGADHFGPAVADKRAAALREAMTMLAEFPEAAPVVPWDSSIRRHASGPHIIFYRIDRDSILIARVLDGRMNWKDVLAEGGDG